MHPGDDALVHTLLEGSAEGAVTAVAALQSQLLGDDGLLCRHIVFYYCSILRAKLLLFQ